MIPSSHRRAVEYSAVDCSSISFCSDECWDGSLKLGRKRVSISNSQGRLSYFETVVITCDSCAEPMTDTFAFYKFGGEHVPEMAKQRSRTGHIHRKRGEY